MKKLVNPTLPARSDKIEVVIDKYNTSLRLLSQALKGIGEDLRNMRNRASGGALSTSRGGGEGGGTGISGTVNTLPKFGPTSSKLKDSIVKEDNAATQINVEGKVGVNNADPDHSLHISDGNAAVESDYKVIFDA